MLLLAQTFPERRGSLPPKKSSEFQYTFFRQKKNYRVTIAVGRGMVLGVALYSFSCP